MRAVASYLAELRAALAAAGVERGDEALADAREFLESELWSLRRARPELAEAEAFARVAERFGPPAEVAEAYAAEEPPGARRPRGVARRAWLALPAAALFASGLAVLPEDEVQVANGSFASWDEGLPEGWGATVGARSGDGPASTVEPAAEGGVALSGDAATGTWRYLYQRFPARAGAHYRLSFEGRLRGAARDAGQYSSHYAGLVFHDGEQHLLAREVAQAEPEAWTPAVLWARAPEGTRSGEVALFLAHTGRLEVRDLALEEAGPEDSFRLLVEHVDRHYSHFALLSERGADWDELVERHRPGLEAVASDPERFLPAAVAMLSELRDQHVWVVGPDGARVPTHVEHAPANFDVPAVVAALEDPRQFGRTGLVGRTKEGYGYALVGSFQEPEEELERFEAALRGLFDAPGLILDLRANGGGDETRGQRLAGLFTEEERAYATSQYRAGPERDAFGPAYPRSFAPRGDGPYLRPLVVLTGPNCVSSGEGFAMMLDVLPQATLLGLPTRGASGNPAPLELPNGVTVVYSRWLSRTLEGELVEGRGVQPDVRVEHAGPGDGTFRAGVAELTRRLAEQAPGR